MRAITYRRFGPPEVLEAGTVTPQRGADLPLTEAADALRHLGQGHARGKLVVSVQPR